MDTDARQALLTTEQSCVSRSYHTRWEVNALFADGRKQITGGMAAIRRLSDAHQKVQDSDEEHGKAVVIGGGVLGLEAAELRRPVLR